MDTRSPSKKFYKWLDGGEEYPEQVSWIKATKRRKSEKSVPELNVKHADGSERHRDS